MVNFDPDSPAACEALFGLNHGPEEAKVRVIPAPWEGTVSFAAGTAAAPEAIREASWQVDLHHPLYGDAIWRAGLFMEEADPRFAQWGRQSAQREAGVINPISTSIDTLLEARVTEQLEAGRIPALLGGEHSIALGGMRAVLKRHPKLGILQIDAHADLRPAYEGFEGSHASVFHNLLLDAGDDLRLVQVGLRDLGPQERHRIHEDHRIHCFFDHDLAAETTAGRPWLDSIESILEPLPEQVWISLDVDGLEPSLCPGTGTPVPGGLSWHQTLGLLQTLAKSGREVVGFDLCEVGASPWDANVGARLLYELAGTALAGVR